MKKICAFALTMVLLMTGSALAASKNPEATTVVVDKSLQYTLNEKKTTLTVKLAGDASAGFVWSHNASVEKTVEEARAGYIPAGNPEGLPGAAGTFLFDMAVARGAKSGEVTLTFEYMQPTKQDVVACYEITLEIGKGGTIEVQKARVMALEDKSVLQFDDVLRYEINRAKKTLRLELVSDPNTGFVWTHQLDETMLVEKSGEYIPSVVMVGKNEIAEGIGTMFYTFVAAEQQEGTTTLTLAETRMGDSSAQAAYELEISISKTGVLTVDKVEKMNHTLYKVGFAVTCPTCMGTEAMVVHVQNGLKPGSKEDLTWKLRLECPDCGAVSVDF